MAAMHSAKREAVLFDPSGLNSVQTERFANLASIPVPSLPEQAWLRGSSFVLDVYCQSYLVGFLVLYYVERRPLALRLGPQRRCLPALWHLPSAPRYL